MLLHPLHWVGTNAGDVYINLSVMPRIELIRPDKKWGGESEHCYIAAFPVEDDASHHIIESFNTLRDAKDYLTDLINRLNTGVAPPAGSLYNAIR